MAKRIITLALAIVCLASVAIVGVSAAFEPANENEVAVCVTLKTPANIEDVQGYITYNADELTVVKAETPNINGAVINTKEAGTIYFNATEVNNGLDFTAEACLMDVLFTALVEEPAMPEVVIEEMTELNGDSYFTNSEKVNDDVVLTIEMISYVAPTTEATVPTTEATVATTEATVATTEATAATTAVKTDATSSTDAGNKPADTVPTGATTAIFAVMAVVAMAGVAVVVLRKKVNG